MNRFGTLAIAILMVNSSTASQGTAPVETTTRSEELDYVLRCARRYSGSSAPTAPAPLYTVARINSLFFEDLRRWEDERPQFTRIRKTDVSKSDPQLDYSDDNIAIAHFDARESYYNPASGFGEHTLWVVAQRGPFHPEFSNLEGPDPRFGISAIVATPRRRPADAKNVELSSTMPAPDDDVLESTFLAFVENMTNNGPEDSTDDLAENSVLRDPRLLRKVSPWISADTKRYARKPEIKIEQWKVLTTSRDLVLASTYLWVQAWLSEVVVMFRPSMVDRSWKVDLMLPTMCRGFY